MNKVAEIRARCTPVEHKALALLARRDSQKMSEVVRRAVREFARQEGVWQDAQAVVVGQEVAT